MGFMTISWWFGIRLWIWLYFGLSLVLGLTVIIYFYRQALKRRYYKIRFPEKILKVIIHYKSGMFKVYWRIVPDEKRYTIEGKQYLYDGKQVVKGDEFFLTKKEGKERKEIIKVGSKEYNFQDIYQIKNRWKKYAEIHYFFNKPQPLNFDMSKGKIDMSSYQLEEFKKNDLFAKLLTLQGEKNLLTFLLIIGVFNLLATLLVVAKIMEWIA